MEELPAEIMGKILSYLVNDGIAIGQLSLCSSHLYRRINRESPKLWKSLIEFRWTVPMEHNYDTTFSQLLLDDDEQNRDGNGQQQQQEDDSDYCLEYIRRHEIDQSTVQFLEEMKCDLQRIFLLTNHSSSSQLVDGSPHVGRAWDHPSWKQILAYRSETMDILKAKSKLPGLHQDDDNNNNDQVEELVEEEENPEPRCSRTTTKEVPITIPVEDRLTAFLAARSLQNVHFAECLHLWKEINSLQEEYLNNHPQHGNSILMERYALLICRIQQSPPELMDGTSADISIWIVQQLDDIARTCLLQIRNVNASTVDEKIHIVNDVLVHQYGFVGNEDDYYNYRNSLLHHVLKTKKAIPITLCVLYTCICRRVEIPAHLTGLPGHVVLGYTNHAGRIAFLDVFRKGKDLSLQDCMRICASYGYPWNPDYLTPLTASQILQRTLNNLNNCHFQAMTQNSPFHSELFFQQRALDTINRQSSDIAGPLVDRVTQEIPLTLSPDLLRYYGLLSSSTSNSSSNTDEGNNSNR